MNDVLKRDIDAIRPDAQTVVRPMSEETHQETMDIILSEIRASFDIYGINFNDETLKVMLVTLIWSGKATIDMFKHGRPTHRTFNTDMDIATHGVLAALHSVINIIDKQEAS